MRDRLLRALRGDPTDVTPIWLMRQAGRYLPGYRALRERHAILEIARDPRLAAEVTLEPVRRFDVDAGVIFADITLPLEGIGVGFRIDPGVGPVIPRPLRGREDVERLTPFDAEAAIGFVGEAIREFRRQEPDRPILGFAGAPFTMAYYLIEGGASPQMLELKRMMYSDPDTFDRLLERLVEMTIDYLRLQVRAGAHALQLFDTWVGALSTSRFERHVLPGLRRIVEAVRSSEVPLIYFSTGSSHLLSSATRSGEVALGVDWRVSLGEVRRQVGEATALQGNLDPAALLAPESVMLKEAESVLRQLPERTGHVFNLGHGVLPETDPERVRALVDFVHGWGPGP